MGVAAVHGHITAIPKDKRNLNHPRQSGEHECVAEELVDHRAEHQLLGVRAHAVARQNEHNPRNDIAFRRAVASAAQPHTHEPRGPPDDAHAGVLQVITHPRVAPAVLGEGVDTAPGGNDSAVEELLAAARATQPELPNEQQQGEDYAVGDKGGSHDEMR